MPNFRKPFFFIKNTFFHSGSSSFNTSTHSSITDTSSSSTDGKDKDKNFVINMNTCKGIMDLRQYLTDSTNLLMKIGTLEKKIHEKFKDINISSEEEDFINKVSRLYDATSDFHATLKCYFKYCNDNYPPDLSRFTKAQKEYERYKEQFEKFEKLDKQRELLQCQWKKILQELKSVNKTKKIKQVKEIMDDLLCDAFDYLNDQNHKKFKKILKENENLCNEYLEKLGNNSPEELDLPNESKPEGEGDKRFHPTISLTTTTSVLFTNKNINSGKGKEREVKRASFSF